MVILTAVFNYRGDIRYKRCLKAMVNSIQKNCSSADFRILRLPVPDPVEGVFQGWVNNHVKLAAYAKHGIIDDTVFVDTDTVFLGDISEVFTDEFDVAVAKRPQSGTSLYNGGVVLMKNNQKAKDFMRGWIETDTQMLYDREFHKIWHEKYRGQNQSSMGYMIERRSAGVKIAEYPTGLINACEQDWSRIKKHKPYVLHVRKKLLDMAQSRKSINHIPCVFRDAVQTWREYEAI